MIKSFFYYFFFYRQVFSDQLKYIENEKTSIIFNNIYVSGCVEYLEWKRNILVIVHFYIIKKQKTKN